MDKSRNVYVETMGCQMNKLDGELIVDELIRRGYGMVGTARSAGVVVYITCSVRAHAEEKVISKIGQLQRRCREEGLVLAVVGCMAQRLGQGLLDEHPHVAVVCGPGRIHQFADLLDAAVGQRERGLALNERSEDDALEAWDAGRERHREANPHFAYVRAMRGCNNFCSYCIVPYVRGPEQSRPLDHIVAESRRLVEAGVREITLVGQAVDAYRYRHNGVTHNLADLLYALHDLPGLARLRFVTNYPANFDPRVLQAMAELPSVCEYLHICAQHGSDRILQAMKRRYTAGQYLDLIAQARETVGGLTVAGDFIVGFPGETDEDFEATCRLVEQVHYKNCFIFKYSPRPGTFAAEHLPDDVPEALKRRRNQELLALQDRIGVEGNQGLVGQTLEVLVEGASRRPQLDARHRGGEYPAGWVQLMGRTRGDQIVVFPGPAGLAGQLVDTRIVKAAAVTLFGEMGENR